MLEENDERRKVIFKKEGVMFNFPKELDQYFVERLGKKEIEPEKRFVINFRFFHKSRPENDEVKFDHALILKVFFKDEDFENADRDPEKIDLFYRLADEKDWVSVKNKHKLQINVFDEPMGEWVGEGYTSISEFIDPVIAWGK